jgi:integrase
MSSHVKLTDQNIPKLPVGFHWDSHSKAPTSFCVRISSATARTFMQAYRRKSDGKQRWLRIGKFHPVMLPVAVARQRAAEIMAEVALGRDPAGETVEQRQAVKEAATVATLAETYIAKELLPKRAPDTQAHYKRLLTNHIVPALGTMKVTAVERSDVEYLHRKITDEGHTRAANAVLTMTHTLFEFAIKQGLRPEHSNPAKRIKRNDEHGRERYLNKDEDNRLTAALAPFDATMPDSPDVIRTLRLTGCRVSEGLKMTWAQLDLDAGVWWKPATVTKDRKPHRVPLSEAAVALLRRRQENPVVRLRDDRVFPFAGAKSPRDKLDRDWRTIRASLGADFANVRLHDLRHSFASHLVSNGASLPLIGRLLGHAKPATTARYSHLYDEPLREAVNLVAKRVTGN